MRHRSTEGVLRSAPDIEAGDRHGVRTVDRQLYEMAAWRIREQQELLSQASQVVGQQRTELKEVREAVLSPRGKTRWGWFTGPSEVPGKGEW
jgi:hypothetical protein